MIAAIVLVIAIFLIAVLYSSVGHAGASGYLAAMALVGLAPDEMKPAALVLNIFVSAIGSYRFGRAGHFSWATLWPFAATSIPLAAFGGAWKLPGYAYKPLVGIVLLVAAWNLIRRYIQSRRSTQESTGAASPALPPLPRMPALSGALLAGAGIGLLSGLTGTGGGIFLSPLLILLNWADPKRTAAVSVVFVLMNSIAGLAGLVWSHTEVFNAQHLYGLRTLPAGIPWYVAAAIAGGIIGSGLGAKKISADALRALLGVVLLIAAFKMFVTAFQDRPARGQEDAAAVGMFEDRHGRALSASDGAVSRSNARQPNGSPRLRSGLVMSS